MKCKKKRLMLRRSTLIFVTFFIVAVLVRPEILVGSVNIASGHNYFYHCEYEANGVIGTSPISEYIFFYSGPLYCVGLSIHAPLKTPRTIPIFCPNFGTGHGTIEYAEAYGPYGVNVEIHRNVTGLLFFGKILHKTFLI